MAKQSEDTAHVLCNDLRRWIVSLGLFWNIREEYQGVLVSHKTDTVKIECVKGTTDVFQVKYKSHDSVTKLCFLSREPVKEKLLHILTSNP